MATAQVEEGEAKKGWIQAVRDYLCGIDWSRLGRGLCHSIRRDWPILAGTIVGGWAVYTWSVADERAAEIRAFEARKPFLERQLAIHFEVAETIGKLLTLEFQSEEWKVAQRRFMEQAEVGLPMVANDKVLKELRQFETTLRKHDPKAGFKSIALQIQARSLIEEMRATVDSTWSRKADWMRFVAFDYIALPSSDSKWKGIFVYPKGSLAPSIKDSSASIETKPPAQP